jgi:2-keto-myo-inositol isomerase
MIQFALNHMTVARLSFRDLVALSRQAWLRGIEVRNDLPQPLFDGMDPAEAGAHVRDTGLRLLAVAEVKRFNDWSPDKEAEALALIRIARACRGRGGQPDPAQRQSWHGQRRTPGQRCASR